VNVPASKGVAVVTGAGTGLGSALARALAREHFTVVLHYRTSRQGAEETLASLHATGAEATLFQADLATTQGAQSLADCVAQKYGSVDLLVNNAGVYHERPTLELTEHEWFEGLNSTVTQTFFTNKALLPLIRKGRLKRIINIGDSSCERPGARDLALSYHVGKTGVWMLTRSLAVSEAPYGIAVNMISPGFLNNSVGHLPDSQIPAGRLGTFEDIYSALRFLALDAPAYMTGSNLVVSGGWNLR